MIIPNPYCLKKPRSCTALYHIFWFNCLHLLISPMPDAQMIFPADFATQGISIRMIDG